MIKIDFRAFMCLNINAKIIKSYLSEFIQKHQSKLKNCQIKTQFGMQKQEKLSNQKLKSYQLDQEEHWVPQIISNGVVVIKNVLKKQEVQKAEDLFWEWLESLGSGVKRNDSSTWDNDSFPIYPNSSFFAGYGGYHNKSSWYLRSHPNVYKAFSKLWKTQDLIVSFDTMIGWRPWWNHKTWEPFALPLHLDQNPYYKRQFCCVQGMIPLRNVRKNQVGGLQVVPRSNTPLMQSQIIKNNPWAKDTKRDFVCIGQEDPMVGTGVLVECDAGDLILWDSRAVHGAIVLDPPQKFKQENNNKLVRLSMTVCMLPRSSASKEVLQKRRKGFEQHVGTTHWANQYRPILDNQYCENIDVTKMKLEWPEITPQIERLI